MDVDELESWKDSEVSGHESQRLATQRACILYQIVAKGEQKGPSDSPRNLF